MRRLSFRLLIFNVLLIFLPIGSFLYLDTFETQLLEKLERAMVQEGRVMASALSGRDLQAEALRIMANLAGRVESRIRVVDVEGRLLADSAVDSLASLPDADGDTGGGTGDPRVSSLESWSAGSARDELLYQIVVPPVRRAVDVLSPPQSALPSAEYYSGETLLSGPEIDAALAGRYGAATRVSTGGQRSVTLYSAIPVIAADGSVRGAVLVSRSTFRILGDLYSLRLDIIRIFAFSVTAAVVLSILLSLTITRPLRKLRDRTELLLLPGSNLHEAVRTGYPSLRRRDEIGDLSRSLQELWQRLESRITLIDDFSADILHEVKNPLAAIRSSAEVVATELGESVPSAGASAAELAPFIDTILRETDRINRLLGELREITQIDTHLEWEEREPVAIAPLLRELAELYGRRGESRTTATGASEGASEGAGVTPVTVSASIDPAVEEVALSANRDRLRQVLGNLLDNALDFARAAIRIEARPGRGVQDPIEIAIEDDGPGVPPHDAERIFHRFYSGRSERNGHDGLGLAVCWAIIEGYGGTIRAENAPEGGARFILVLPTTAIP